jgi:hypothetical protein
VRIASLMSADLCTGHPDRGEEGREHDVQLLALQTKGKKRGIQIEAIIWDTPDIDWARYDAVLVATPWDYPLKREAFFETLTRIDQQTKLFNPLTLMRWNVDKAYLKALAEHNVPSIPTVWADKADADTISKAFSALKCDEIVIKPRFGANAWRQVRLKRGAAIPPAADLPPEACFIQPFLTQITDYGEISLLYYEGVFSHGVRKIPGSGDYRVQSGYGGREIEHRPDQDEFAIARAAIAALPQMPLYARIDLVRNDADLPVVMEVELIEPYHYPEQGPGFAGRLLDGIIKRLP